MIRNIFTLALFSITFLIVGFLLSTYLIGKHSERQLKESIINEKLILMNSIATEIGNLNTTANPRLIINILCNHVSPLKNEATSIGPSTSKANIPDHIEYADFVVNKYSNIASVYEIRECELQPTKTTTH